MPDHTFASGLTKEQALEEIARLNQEAIEDEITVGVMQSEISELRELLSQEQARAQTMRDTLERIAAPSRLSPPEHDAASQRLAATIIRHLEPTPYEIVADRSPQFLDGARWAMRRCVAWLHAEAASMNDPKARDVLNSAAFKMGSWKRRAVDTPKHAEDDP